MPKNVKWLRDICFAEVGQRKLMLDLYIPKVPEVPETTEMPEASGRPDATDATVQCGGAFPVVVWIHGGGWLDGGKFPAPGAWLAAHGYAVASITYRFSTEAVFPAQLFDCKAAVRWLRAKAEDYNLDQSRIGVIGESAGGHLAAMLGVTGDLKELEGDVGGNLEYSSRVQAVCDCFGPVDFTNLEDKLKKDLALTPQMRYVLEKLLGPDGDVQKKADAASAVTYISPDDPPFLIVHGDRDRLVPISQSRTLHDLQKKAGLDTELLIMKGGGHIFFNNIKVRRRIQKFFDAKLKKPVKQQMPEEQG